MFDLVTLLLAFLLYFINLIYVSENEWNNKTLKIKLDLSIGYNGFRW